MTLPCATCHTKCCQAYLVALSGYDVWTISRGLRMPPEQFVRPVEQEKPDSRSFLLDRSGKSYYMVLDKLRTKQSTACIFWMAVEGGTAGRCGIYPYRPLVCRVYPATLEGDGVARREDVLCPIEAWRDDTLQRPPWHMNLLHMQVDFDIYWLAAARWNAHVLRYDGVEGISLNNFLDYLMNFYARLEPLREGLGVDSWNEMCVWWDKLRVQSVNPLATGNDTSERWPTVVEEIRDIAETFFVRDFAPV